MGLSAEEEQVFEKRTEQYGDFVRGHESLGLAWTGLLENHYQIKLAYPVPAHLVLLMMSGSKLIRAATPTPGQPDDYDDAKIYIELARLAKEREDLR